MFAVGAAKIPSMEPVARKIGKTAPGFLASAIKEIVILIAYSS
jgi:hypothetical protein